MNLLKKMLPRTGSFFDFFEQHSRLSKEACAELDALANHPDQIEARVARIDEIEHEADRVTHRCIDALHSTFITPIDRSDIHRLIRRLDDIIDAVDSIAARLSMYGMDPVRPEMPQLTRLLVDATGRIDEAVQDLRKLNERGQEIQQHCMDVYLAESRADKVLRSALVSLFAEERDPIQLMKWKEILERLERATDRCQETAHIISGIVIEAS